MKALTIRRVDPRLARALEREAARRETSLNQTVLDLLKEVLGVGTETPRESGLRRLAGTWSAKELAEFESNAVAFERVDEELWS